MRSGASANFKKSHERVANDGIFFFRRQIELVHGIDRPLAAHVEGVIAPEHDVISAESINQKPQSPAVMRKAIAKDAG